MDEVEGKTNNNSRAYAQLLDEYKEAGLNWRYYGEVRFKQFTLFLTSTAVLLAAVSSATFRGLPRFAQVGVHVIGLAVTFAFFVLEERSTFYRRAYMKTALDLEDRLHFTEYIDAKNDPLFGSRYVFRLLFSVIAGVWMLLGGFAIFPGTFWNVNFAFFPLVSGTLLHRRLERYQERAGEAALRRYSARHSLLLSPTPEQDKVERNP